MKICSKFTGEHPCGIVISKKLQSNFIEIIILHGCSPVNLLHIFRIPFLKSTSGRLLLLLFTEAIYVIFRKEFWDQTIRNTLRAEIFAVDWSKIFKFGGINFRDSAINSKFFGIKFCGWCLDRKTNQLEVKFTTNVKYLPLNCWFKYQK